LFFEEIKDKPWLMSDDLGATVPGYITKMCFSAKYEFICP